jgi:hypothetical protein
VIRSSGSQEEHSIHFLAVVAAVTILVAALAWVGQSRSLALATAVLGLYALHILSIRFILEGQRRQRAALESQWELLRRLMGQVEENTDAGSYMVPAVAVIDTSSPESDRRTAPRQVAATAPTEVSYAAAHGVSDPWLGDAEVLTPRAAMEVMPAGDTSNNGSEAYEDDGRREAEPEPLQESWSADGNELTADEVGDLVAHRELVEPAVAEPDEDASVDFELERVERPSRSQSDIPIPRHFALGTVALVRDLLTPAEVARVLLQQRKQPEKKFATLAVELGLLTESEREELLLAQQEGLFTDAEMREARQRLKEFRESTARALSELS